MWLDDSFKAPHLLHPRGVGHDVEDDCPHCNLQGALKPSHLLACPNLGPPLFQHGFYANHATRWNQLDPTVLAPLLCELQQRHLRTFSVQHSAAHHNA